MNKTCFYLESKLDLSKKLMAEKKFRNPTRAEKIAYKEKLQHGQGMDLEPKSFHEIHKDKKPFLNEDEESRMDGSKNLQYRRNDKGLGDPSMHDDYSEDSLP
jgi:hypothetical protein